MGDLVKGLLVVISIAMATGNYGELQRWAARECAKSLAWNEPLPYFFSENQHREGIQNRVVKIGKPESSSQKTVVPKLATSRSMG